MEEAYCNGFIMPCRSPVMITRRVGSSGVTHLRHETTKIQAHLHTYRKVLRR